VIRETVRLRRGAGDERKLQVRPVLVLLLLLLACVPAGILSASALADSSETSIEAAVTALTAETAVTALTAIGAPVLSVSGDTVHWSPVALESTYGVAISNDARGTGDRETHYVTIPRTANAVQSYTPELTPGETVYIGVTANGTTWSEQEVTVTAAPEPEPEPEVIPAAAAPVLSVSGDTVHWSPVALESTYGVAISNDARGTGDRETHYVSIPRTASAVQSYTPELTPGETVYIGVTANGTTWSEQEITVTGAAQSKAEPEPEPELTPRPPAPVLSVRGNTLTWKALPGVTSYELATVMNPTTTRNTTYKTITGTSFTPPAVPGQTVNYGLAARTPVAGPWAQEVTIVYPPPATSGGGSSTEGGSSGSGDGLGELGGSFVKGINANLAGWGLSNLPAIASEMSSLGVNWEREPLNWSEVEPQKGVFDWSSFDQVVAAAKVDGITLLPLLGYAPSWTSPDDATDYAAFVAAAVARYGPGTTANLKWWELWNEPYFAYAWSGHTPEPEAYGRDALAAAEAAKAVSPSVKLLIAADYQESAQTGGSSPEEKTWINDMFTAAPTLGKWIDGVSVHPYGGDPSLPLKETGGYLDTSGQWGFQRIDTIREKFLAHGMNVPFWITEEGWSTWENSEATVAHNYADLITQIKQRPWIRALFPFGLREGVEHPTNNQAGFALLKFGTWQPKEAWGVLQEGLKTLN
jgi:hypothetical protein